MNWRLTPEERRIMERTRRKGEEMHALRTPGARRRQARLSVLVWAGAIILFTFLAILIAYAGTFFVGHIR